MWVSTLSMRSARSGGISPSARRRQSGPPLSMNAASTMIVTKAKTPFTIPKPMSRSTPAAPPILLGSLAASSSSLSVIW